MLIFEFATIVGVVFFVLHAMKNHFIAVFVNQGLMTFWAYFALFVCSLDFFNTRLDPVQAALLFYFLLIGLTIFTNVLLKDFVANVIRNLIINPAKLAKNTVLSFSIATSIAFGVCFCLINIVFVSKFFIEAETFKASPLIQIVRMKNIFGSGDTYQKITQKNSVASFLTSYDFFNTLGLPVNQFVVIESMVKRSPNFDLKDVEVYHKKYNDNKKTMLFFIKLYLKSYPTIATDDAVSIQQVDVLRQLLLYGHITNQVVEKEDEALQDIIKQEVKKDIAQTGQDAQDENMEEVDSGDENTSIDATPIVSKKQDLNEGYLGVQKNNQLADGDVDLLGEIVRYNIKSNDSRQLRLNHVETDEIGNLIEQVQ